MYLLMDSEVWGYGFTKEFFQQLYHKTWQGIC